MSLRLTFVSWNIHRCIGTDRKFRPERVLEVLEHHRPDVLLLQEVDRGAPRSRRLYLDHLIADELGFPYHSWALAHELREGGYGNATLSKLPIAKRRVVDLTIGRRKRRNALYTRIQLPHRTDLRVFNWHLGLAAHERRKQVERVMRSNTLRHQPDKSPVLLAGDTNDWRNQLYSGAGIENAGFHAWSEHGRRRPLRTYPSRNPIGALDKFFWRGPVHHVQVHVSRLDLARMASDHLPVVAEMRIGTT